MKEEKRQVIGFLDCSSGISGDMFLGAAFDAGFPLETLRQALTSVPITGYTLDLAVHHDKGIRGKRFSVSLEDREQPTRHLTDIVALINAASLPTGVGERAIAIFRCLAEAEAAVHGTTIESVHFHEVGAVDSIIDIIGAALAIETLGITALYSSDLPLSSGHITTAHGLLPVPAPATLEILRRVSAPWKPCPVEGEMVTPTGAAILATLAHFETPRLRIETVGYGFGQKSFPWPNCLRLCLGAATMEITTDTDAPETDRVTVIETNIDTMTGEQLGGLLDRLLAVGALDASYTPLQMKKNRPAVQLTVIALEEDGEALARLLLAESTTLGVRIQQVERRKATRALQRIETPLGPLTVKVKLLGNQVISASPEYEDCRRIALERNLPLSDVYDLVQESIKRTIIKS